MAAPTHLTRTPYTLHGKSTRMGKEEERLQYRRNTSEKVMAMVKYFNSDPSFRGNSAFLRIAFSVLPSYNWYRSRQNAHYESESVLPTHTSSILQRKQEPRVFRTESNALFCCQGCALCPRVTVLMDEAEYLIRFGNQVREGLWLKWSGRKESPVVIVSIRRDTLFQEWEGVAWALFFLN